MPKKFDAALIDINGCLSDVRDRLKFIEQDPKDWESFFDALERDKVNEWCKKLIEMVEGLDGPSLSRHRIIFITGTPEFFRERMVAWLIKHGLNPRAHRRKLIMRPDGDKMVDHFFKLEAYRGLIERNFNLKYVVDDSAAVCQQFAKLGIPSLCVFGEGTKG